MPIEPPHDDPPQTPDPADSLSPTVPAGPPRGAEDSGDRPYVHVPTGAGQRFGDFEIVREIGRGGMGIVFEARQISLNRPVALKLLPPGLGMTSESVRRFEREAQTAARLHHTNIVPVFAIGSQQGSYFYAMELVQGQPLNDILKTMRGGQSSPLMERTVTQVGADPAGDRAPEPRTEAGETSAESSGTGGTRAWFDTVAKLMADVADALHYAHGRGVIHRDIKPGNLMLSSDGRLCLMDFGLARATEEPGMTVTGSFMGTPAYMSPEQIAAGRIRVDERSDIYSLGAVLYEMLTFQRPFPGESRDEILTAIMTRDPAPPRRVNPRVPQDLETICLKAMEKDPQRRYASAAAMAEDLRRFMHRGLILAKRASLPRRALRFVQRNPVQVTVAAAVLVLAVGGFGAFRLLSAQRAEAAAVRSISDARYYLSEGEYQRGLEAIDAAIREAPHLEEARLLRARLLIRTGRADEAVDEAKRVIASNPRDWTAHLVMVMAAGDGERGSFMPGIDVQAHLQVVEEEAPETSDAYYVRAMTANSDGEAVRLLGRALELDPGHTDALTERIYRHEALKNFASAIDDAERLAILKPKSARGRQLVGWIRGRMHDQKTSVAAFERAIEIDPDDPIAYRLRAEVLLTDEKPVEALADYDRAVALDSTHVPTLIARSAVRLRTGDYEGAITDAERALEVRPDASRAFGNMYFAYRSMGRMDELQRMIEGARSAAASWKDAKLKAQFFSSIAMGAMELGQLDVALALADTGVMLKPDLPSAYGYRAFIKRMRGNIAGAEEDCERCAAIELVEPHDLYERASFLSEVCRRRDLAIADLDRAIELAPEWAEPHGLRGTLLRNQRRYDESIASYSRALELAPAWGTMYNNRAINYVRMGQHERALADYDRTIELGTGSVTVHINRSSTLARLGRVDEALAALEDGRPLEPNRGIVDERRGKLLRELGRLDESLAAYDRALEIEPENGSIHAGRGLTLALMPGQCGAAVSALAKARTLVPANDATVGYAVATAHLDVLAAACTEGYQQSMAYELALETVKFAPTDPNFLVLAGSAYYRNARYADADRTLRQALETAEGPENPKTLFFLAMTKARMGRAAEALGLYQRAVNALRNDFPSDPQKVLLRDEAARVLGVS